MWRPLSIREPTGNSPPRQRPGAARVGRAPASATPVTLAPASATPPHVPHPPHPLPSPSLPTVAPQPFALPATVVSKDVKLRASAQCSTLGSSAHYTMHRSRQPGNVGMRVFDFGRSRLASEIEREFQETVASAQVDTSVLYAQCSSHTNGWGCGGANEGARPSERGQAACAHRTAGVCLWCVCVCVCVCGERERERERVELRVVLYCGRCSLCRCCSWRGRRPRRWRRRPR